MWFETLTGFRELNPDQVRANLSVAGDRLKSAVNGQSHGCGRLELPSLAELRDLPTTTGNGPVVLREVIADVQKLHRDPANAGALFQAASQFNLLEMVSPNVTPEAGVGRYEQDRTQGPACAVACGAGTIFRNYFVPIGDRVGQTADRQIDCLADVGAALGNRDGNRDGSLWAMHNGYALLTDHGLNTLGPRLAQTDPGELDALRGRLRIGAHYDVEVTVDEAGHRVTQVYGSALPVAYGRGDPAQWADFARLVLEASYEATLRVAMLNAARTGNRRVFLTLLGGGVFGNEETWILAAIARALAIVGQADLDVAIVSYGRSQRGVCDLVASWGAGSDDYT